MLDADRLIKAYAGPSRYDCFSLAVARQEGCPLLTGDGRLRKAASKEAVVVMGTIWPVEQVVIHGLADCAEARSAYDRMRASGSRLPWDTAISRLDLL